MPLPLRFAVKARFLPNIINTRYGLTVLKVP